MSKIRRDTLIERLDADEELTDKERREIYFAEFPYPEEEES